MALGDLKKELYQNDARKRAHEKTIYNPDKSRTAQNRLGEESPWQAQEREGLERSWRGPLLRIAIAFGVVVLLLFAAWTFITIRAHLFDVQRLTVTIDGPTTVGSGMAATYTVRYTNDNSVTLTDARLEIEHTPAFIIDEASGVRYDSSDHSTLIIGEIAPHETKDVRIQGRFEDFADSEIYIKAVLSAVPSTTGKRVVREQRLGLMRSREGLSLTVDAQKSVPNNGVIEYIVRYTNSSTQSYENVTLVADFPQGFTLQSAEPEAADGDHVWQLGTIAPGTEGRVRIRGMLSGVVDDVKMSVFTLALHNGATRSVLAREEWTTRIAQAALTITQRVNNATTYVAHAGENLSYTLIYKNTSDLGLRDVVVRLKFDDRILDYTDLRLGSSGGSLEAQTRSIVWRAADIPALALLAPGQGGRIDFTIPVRSDITVRDDSDRNLVISTTAEIDSPDVPTPIGENKVISSNTLRIKLASPVRFTTEGFYDDFTIKNTGPVPPIVNEKTTFTIRWTLTNATNVLTNAKVEAFLPTSVHWEGVTFPESETLQFNPRTHKIVWHLGEVENGTGYFRKAREVRFQISVTPTIDQVGEAVPLLKESVFTAHDTFTNTNIRIVGQAKTTALSEDPTTRGGMVRN